MKTIRMQERSHISNAVTELEIGAENLQNRDDNIDKATTVQAPGTIEHVEKGEADAKQETNPGQNCRQEEAQLTQLMVTSTPEGM